MRRSSSCDVRRIGSKARLKDVNSSKFRALFNPALLSGAVVTLLGLIMLVLLHFLRNSDALHTTIYQLTSHAQVMHMEVPNVGLFRAVYVYHLVQINLCTLAIRQEQMPKFFHLPGSSGNHLHIDVKKAVGATDMVTHLYQLICTAKEICTSSQQTCRGLHSPASILAWCLILLCASACMGDDLLNMSWPVPGVQQRPCCKRGCNRGAGGGARPGGHWFRDGAGARVQELQRRRAAGVAAAAELEAGALHAGPQV